MHMYRKQKKIGRANDEKAGEWVEKERSIIENEKQLRPIQYSF